MTNEELAIEIQKGHDEYMDQLWDQVQRLANKIVIRISHKFKCPQYIDMDDLFICGYYGLINAVKAYDPQKGYKLGTYLTFHVLQAIKRELGIHTSKRQIEAISYDAPVGNDTEDISLLDSLEDETAQYEFEKIELTDLQRHVADALSHLSDIQQRVIRLHYFDELTLKRTGELLGLSANRIRRIQVQAFRILRKNRKLMSLNEEYGDHYIIKNIDYFKYTEAYYRMLEHIHKRLEAGEYISYGKRQALLYQFES